MKRVFILSRHSLFGHGVESLLRQEAELEVVGRETVADRALERIQELQPDVVIVENDDPELDLKPVVMHILNGGSGITVVGLSPQNNIIHIYRGEHGIVREVEDLVGPIK